MQWHTASFCDRLFVKRLVQCDLLGFCVFTQFLTGLLYCAIANFPSYLSYLQLLASVL